MTKSAKSAGADREPAPEADDDVPVSAVILPEPVAAPALGLAVLLRATNGVRRGVVVRGPSEALSDLIANKDARPATEADIAVSGRVVDL